MLRYSRDVNHKTRAEVLKAICPAANHNTECDKNGEITPATTAPSKVTAKDWQDATVPRMCGNRSSASSVAPGATTDMPKV